MEDVLEAVKRLDVNEQRRLLVGLLSSHPADTQLSLFVPVLTATPGYVKWRVSCMLNSHDTPDLVMLLPPELQLAILSFVDGPSLLNASLVSHSWHSLIKSHQQLWLEKCRHMGMNFTPSLPYRSPLRPPDWQQVYVATARQNAALKCGRAFTQRSLNLHNCRTPVKAVDYRDGYLCTVSEADQVTIWHLGLNVAVLTFPCQRTVSCLCLHPSSLLMCGHFTGILTSWDLAAMPRPTQNIKDPANSDHPCSSSSSPHHFSSTTSGEYQTLSGHCLSQTQAGVLKNKFKMHAGPVFSCDFSDDLDLLVSGGADECLKLWSLSSGLLLHSLATRNHWVLWVKFLPASDDAHLSSVSSSSVLDSKEVARHKILYMTRQRVAKISWPASHRKQSEDISTESESLTDENVIQLECSKTDVSSGECAKDSANKLDCKAGSVSSNFSHTCFKNVNFSTKTEKDNNDTSQQVSQKNKYGDLNEILEDGGINLPYGDDVVFTPGLQMSRKYIALVQQDVEGKNARLHLIDVETLARLHSLLLGFKVKKLLALGDRYGLLLTPGSVLYSSTLTILDVVTGSVAGSCTVPHSKMTTPDGAQIVVGEVEWLNGLGPHLPEPPLAPAPETKKKLKICAHCMSEQANYENQKPTNITPCQEQVGEWVLGDHLHRRPSSDYHAINPCFDSNPHSLTGHLAPPNSSPERFLSRHQKCDSEENRGEDGQIGLKLAKERFLVLAAGVQTEPGRLFTLWWAEAGQEYKRKKD